jgi:hypothetical protein
MKPNTGRIIVELIRSGDKEGDLFLPTRENVKAGENLLVGKVIAPGDSSFKEGQLVMFQEYSMSGIYKDIQALVDGSVPVSETIKPENQYHVIATSDIVAYDD